MLVRPYTESDLDALRRMHASQGFDYAFPDLADPIFISKLVLENDDGRPVMASLARLTCEMYLLIDRESDAAAIGDVSSRARACFRPDEGSAFSLRGGKSTADPSARSPTENVGAGLGMTPSGKGSARKRARVRWAQLLALHRAGELDLLARGLDDAHAWLPPPIARRFGRRLESLGWLRDDSWTPYCKRFRP